MDDSRLRTRFERALDAAGLRRMQFHDLRHTFGTIAVQAFPLSDVQAFMGHADIATTMIYVHHVPQEDAADRLTRLVAAAQGLQMIVNRGSNCGNRGWLSTQEHAAELREAQSRGSQILNRVHRFNSCRGHSSERL